MCSCEHIDHGTQRDHKGDTNKVVMDSEQSTDRATQAAAQAEMSATRGTKDMLHESNSNHEKAEPLIYQIRIQGHLDCKWSDWFCGLRITSLENGETLLTGPVLDQAMLHSLLRKVRDVGLPLVAVMQVEPEQIDRRR